MSKNASAIVGERRHGCDTDLSVLLRCCQERTANRLTPSSQRVLSQAHVKYPGGMLRYVYIPKNETSVNHAFSRNLASIVTRSGRPSVRRRTKYLVLDQLEGPFQQYWYGATGYEGGCHTLPTILTSGICSGAHELPCLGACRHIIPPLVR
jgi:hypothetical protein